MANQFFNNLVFLGGVALLTACGGGSSSSPTVTTYNGKWRPIIECEPDNGDGTSSKGILTIAGAKGTTEFIDYSASTNCTGAHQVIKLDLVLSYGADVSNASSICANTKKINVTVASVSIDGVKISKELWDKLIASGQLSTLDKFDLICTDSNKLYFGDDEKGVKSGSSDATRPTKIDDMDWMLKS